ncbi:tRNA-dihydrouridine synthase [Paremcibacter congregatus]|uniref:tRNA-dihydrouridine synthase n=1 Tax=Paremcibacter congregatus TaxID=2043170 RepID=UPI0030EC96D4|tara:strand:+ start:7611 stop:8543 length:933 start_codon:yes stop_codon:yes gene_type:complete
MKIILAPMEGVVDHAMRELLTAGGDYDLCITEFVRVVDQAYKPAYFHKISPELRQGGITRAGTPVRIQLLGQHPQWMAENAVTAAALGSPGVDLNFGCPAKTVNRHKGGAVLLKEPETLYQIVRAVRAAVPAAVSVSAKMRLGYETADLANDCARAIEAAGADMLTVHARTKVEGYRPPAHWHVIDDIRQQVAIPVIANGDIWSRADAEACRRISGCNDIMIGRGGLSLPNLAATIRRDKAPQSWAKTCDLLIRYAVFNRDKYQRGYLPSRIKQWFSYLKRQYPEAPPLFEKIKRLRDVAEMIEVIRRER